jgi:NAD(P)-dependent dehydrogenase (short-subunit alcohol dehydrogenase family)
VGSAKPGGPRPPAQPLQPSCALVFTPLIPATLEPEHVKKLGQETLWKRPAQPVEIAAGFVYLASADARNVTGETLAITGKGGSR